VCERYPIHGLVLESSVPLPLEPLPKPCGVDDGVVYRRSFRETPPPGQALRTRVHQPESPWAIERWYGVYVLVEFPGWATFEVRPDEIVLIEQVVADDDLVSHLLLDHVVPRVVALRGDLMLHASGAVGPSGHAHLFLGPAGAGKSTLATSLALHGWTLLDDDGVRTTSRNGQWSATPGYAGVRLLPDAAAALAPGVIGDPMARGHQKLRYRIADLGIQMAAGYPPIAGAYVLRWSESVDAPQLGELRFAERIHGVARHAFHFALDPHALTRSAFERTTSFASRVPVRELVQPWASVDTKAVVRMLADVDAGLHG
jgi:hypothetical protein